MVGSVKGVGFELGVGSVSGNGAKEAPDSSEGVGTSGGVFDVSDAVTKASGAADSLESTGSLAFGVSADSSADEV